MPTNVAKHVSEQHRNNLNQILGREALNNPVLRRQQIFSLLEKAPKECLDAEKKILRDNSRVNEILDYISKDNSGSQLNRLKHYLLHNSAALRLIAQKTSLYPLLQTVLQRLLAQSPLEESKNTEQAKRILAEVNEAEMILAGADTETMLKIIAKAPEDLRLSYLTNYLIHKPNALAPISKNTGLTQIIRPVLLKALATLPENCSDEQRIILAEASEATFIELILTTDSDELKSTYLKHYLWHNPKAITTIRHNETLCPLLKKMLLAILAKSPQDCDDYEKALFTKRASSAVLFEMLKPSIESLTPTQLMNYSLYRPTYFNAFNNNKQLNAKLQQPLLELLKKAPSGCNQYEKVLLAEPTRAAAMIVGLGQALTPDAMVNLMAHCPQALIELNKLNEYKTSLTAIFLSILGKDPADFSPAEKSIIANPQHIPIILKLIEAGKGNLTAQHLQHYAMANGVALIAIFDNKTLRNKLLKEGNALAAISKHYEVEYTSNQQLLLSKLKSTAIEKVVLSAMEARRPASNKPVTSTPQMQDSLPLQGSIDCIIANPKYTQYLTPATRLQVVAQYTDIAPEFDWWKFVYTPKERKTVLTSLLSEMKTEMFSMGAGKASAQPLTDDNLAHAKQFLKNQLRTQGIIGHAYRTKLLKDKTLIKQRQNWLPLACLSAYTNQGLLDFIKDSRSQVTISGGDLVQLFAYTAKNNTELSKDTYTGILKQGRLFWNLGRKFSNELRSLIKNCKPGHIKLEIRETLRSILANDTLRGHLNLRKHPALIKKLTEIGDPVLDEILAKDKALSALLANQAKYNFFSKLPEGSWLEKALNPALNTAGFKEYILKKYQFIIDEIVQEVTPEQLNELVKKYTEIKKYVLASPDLVEKWTQAKEFDAVDYVQQSALDTSGYRFDYLPQEQYEFAAKAINSKIIDQFITSSDAKISTAVKRKFIKVVLENNPQIKPKEIRLLDYLALELINNDPDFIAKHFDLVKQHFAGVDFGKGVETKAAAKLIASGHLTETQAFSNEQLEKIWISAEIGFADAGKKLFEPLFKTADLVNRFANKKLASLLSKIISPEGHILPLAKPHLLSWLRDKDYKNLIDFLQKPQIQGLITQESSILSEIMDGDYDLAIAILKEAEHNQAFAWLIKPLTRFASQENLQAGFATALYQERNLASLHQFLESNRPEIKNLIALLAEKVPDFGLHMANNASLATIHADPELYIKCIENSEFATKLSTQAIENLLQANEQVSNKIIEQITGGNIIQKSAIAKDLLIRGKIAPTQENSMVFESLWKPKLQELEVEQLVKLLAIYAAKTALLKDFTTCCKLLSSEQVIFTVEDEEQLKHLWEEPTELEALETGQCLQLLKIGMPKATAALLSRPGLLASFTGAQLVELLKLNQGAITEAILAEPTCGLKLVNFIATQPKEFEFTQDQVWLMFCHNDELREAIYAIDNLRKKVLSAADALGHAECKAQEKAAETYVLTKRIAALQNGEAAAVAKLSAIVAKILNSATKAQWLGLLDVDREGQLEIREAVFNEIKCQLEQKSWLALHESNPVILPVILTDQELRTLIYPELDIVELVNISSKEIAQWLFTDPEGFAQYDPDTLSMLLTDPDAKALLTMAVTKLEGEKEPYLSRYFKEKLAKNETNLVELKVAIENLLAMPDFRDELAHNQAYSEFKDYVLGIFKPEQPTALLTAKPASLANSPYNLFSAKASINEVQGASKTDIIEPANSNDPVLKGYEP